MALPPVGDEDRQAQADEIFAGTDASLSIDH